MTRRLLATAALLACAVTAHGWYFSGSTWPTGPVVMHLQLGAAGSTLLNGCADWGCAAEDQLATWNYYLDRVEFRVVRDSTVPKRDGDGVNSVFWDDEVYGEAFDAGTLAITVRWFRGGTTTSADVVFNEALRWNAYEGPLRRATGGGTLQDFGRVALHEFGHVLGLGHPDEHGQAVDAVMNSRVSDRDTLAWDDIQGAYTLYGANVAGAAVPFPPRNETFDFRAQLEAKYRNALRRPLLQSYADVEGSVVWTSEYLRYRLNACAHGQATARVGLQIAGLGVQPVCGAGSLANLAFPPRNEPLQFREELEEVYRDVLGRGAVLTAVDVEGDVVWITEYLRYRLSRCGHAAAVEKVMLQIDGRGVQPGC